MQTELSRKLGVEHAVFGLAEVKRALFPAGGGTTLSARIPLAFAMEMGLTGDAGQTLAQTTSMGIAPIV